VTVTSYHLPTSVAEAVGLLQAHGPDLLVLAGGTVAMPLVNEGIARPTRVMGLRRTGMEGIEPHRDGLRIGAMTTLTALAEQRTVPLLAAAAQRTASWAVRNMATVGGNLFSAPRGGDVATALLALDAAVEATGSSGIRTIPLDGFFTGPMSTALAPDELVTAIVVPAVAGSSTFLKFGRRTANSPAVVTVAARLVMDGALVGEARLALGAAGPHPVRVRTAEATLVGRAVEAAAIVAAAKAAEASVEPLADAIASDWYRRRMVPVIVRRALEELAAGVSGRAA
jgi:CO/xanthine dehydrogenase FAD-binding subunit